jgi:hypothetical protein
MYNASQLHVSASIRRHPRRTNEASRATVSMTHPATATIHQISPGKPVRYAWIPALTDRPRRSRSSFIDGGHTAANAPHPPPPRPSSHAHTGPRLTQRQHPALTCGEGIKVKCAFSEPAQKIERAADSALHSDPRCKILHRFPAPIHAGHTRQRNERPSSTSSRKIPPLSFPGTLRNHAFCGSSAAFVGL